MCRETLVPCRCAGRKNNSEKSEQERRWIRGRRRRGLTRGNETREGSVEEREAW